MKIHVILATLVTALVVLIVGCKKDDYEEKVGVCPIVISTVPTNDSTGIPIDQVISVTFNELMNPGTITQASFTLEGTTKASGAKVSGTLAYDGTTPTFSFTPSAQLAPNTTYKGTVSQAVKDLMGNALQEDYEWSFTTAQSEYSVNLSSNLMAGGTTSGGGSFVSGTSVTVVATPSTGYIFLNWTEGTAVVSENASYAFAISQTRTLVANFEKTINTYTVNLSSYPLAGGTTTGAGSYVSGVSVSVQATPNEGYIFTNWKEGTTVVSVENDYIFNITGNRTLVANFEEKVNTYTVSLSANPLAGGSTSGSGSYTTGTSVSLLATPNSGYTFINWTEGTNVISTTAGFSFTINRDRTLVANFEESVNTYTVNLSANPPTGGTTSGEGSYISGASVTVQATPNTGYTFTNWTEGANIVSSDASFNFTITGNRTLVANFEESVNTYTVSLSANPLAGGSTSGSGSYTTGTSVSLLATPNSGYTFINWTEGTNVVSTTASFSFTINRDRTLVANFEESVDTYTVNLSSNPSAGGTTSGGGSYLSAASVTVQATPNTGYSFTNWTEGANIVSSNASYNFTITGNRTLVANFEATTSNYNVSLSSNPSAGGSTTGDGSYSSGASVTVEASTNTGYSFTNWTEGANIVSSNASYNFTITGNRTLVANFASSPNGPGVVNLGTAGNFVILTKTGISNTGATSVTGDIGVSPATSTAITGFDLALDASNEFATSPYVDGKVYASDYAEPTKTDIITAISDLETAYTAGNGFVTAPIVELYAGNLNGQTLAPGLYKWSSGVDITTGITLDGGPNDTWIFQVAQNFTIADAAIITLSGGAQVKNIAWIVAGKTTIGAGADFSGIILCQTLISLNSGAKVTGRMLSQTAVTLIGSTVIERN